MFLYHQLIVNVLAVVNILTIKHLGWKIAVWIDRLAIAVCINEQKLQHMNGYIGWIHWMDTLDEYWNNFPGIHMSTYLVHSILSAFS